MSRLSTQNGAGLSVAQTLALCSFFIALSLGWAVLPVLGVSAYVLEGALTSCSLDWTNKSLVSFVYVIGLFVCVYFLPLMLIIYCHCQTIKIVRRLRYNEFIS